MSTDSRVLLPDETRLVRTLIAVAGLDLPSNWVDEVLVADLADGGMGNVRFLPVKIGQRMGIEAAEVRFRDADGVEVSATLNLDEAVSYTHLTLPTN